MPYFKSILLVDDDEATNFYHRIMLEEWDAAENIYVCTHGAMALDFINNHPTFRFEQPSLILLDINMPVMNGFEFLEQYAHVEESLKATHILFMLTTSLHQRDIDRASGMEDLKGYFNKPLTLEQLELLMI
jgi:CheY-like chemotaxis protein